MNCNYTLGEVYNFCPNCGQENNDHNVTLGTLIGDFFSNYFGVDSRFWSTFRPFFLKPGELTNHFNRGKRKAFVQPIRLYLVQSLIYFFVLGLVGDQLDNWQGLLERSENLDGGTINLNNPMDSVTIDKWQGIADSLSQIRLDTLVLQELVALEDSINQGPTMDFDVISDSLGNQRIKVSQDLKLDQVILTLRNISLSDSTARATLGWDQMRMREFKQLRKITQSDLAVFVSSILQNIPVMMFFMVPVFALLLRLWYVRRKTLYIQHLIHGLHLHAFAYTVFSIAITAMLYATQLEEIRVWIGLVAFLIVTVYAYLSFLRVYGQHWFKTFLKFMLQGWLYSTILFLAGFAAVTLSFYLY